MIKIGYTINPGKSAVIDFDEKNFHADVHAIGEKGYEFEQDFDNHDISHIKTIVLVGVSPDRVVEVAELYGITPSETRITEDDDIEYTFRFVNSVYPKRGYLLGRELAQLYDGEYRLYKRWKDQCKVVNDHKIFVTPTSLHQIFAYSALADSINEGVEQTVNLIDVEDVMAKLKGGMDVDRTLNITPNIGPNFHLAVRILGSQQTAYKFFNNEYNAGFIVETQDEEQYIVDGTTLTASGVYVSPNGGYVRAGAAGGNDVKMTNFTISIHYKLIRQSGESVFIVSMTNEQGHTIEHLEWKNISSETAILDFVMKFGNFHIYGGKASIIKLHEMVTTASVPTIYSVAQYGYNDYKGNKVMVFPDGVYDMDNRKFFPKHDTLPYYFLGGHDGMGIDGESEAALVSKEQVPLFGQVTKAKMQDYIDISSQIYQDDTAWIMWMFACSMAGVSCYYHDTAVPSYYVSGVTGSGKSTFARYLAASFGVKNLYNIRESTVYPVKILLSAFKGLPAFLSEFRTEMKSAADKMGLIQMCYDRSETGKGLKNGGIIKYKMESQVFCEGEDTYDEGSIRSRSIMFEAKKAARVEGSLPLKILKDNERTISSFFANFLDSTCQQDYDVHKVVGQQLFAKAGIEPRLSDNMGIMYAGCMTFAPDHKDKFIEVCHSLLNQQVIDYNANGESQKVISLIAQYLNKGWSTVYLQDGYVILDWNDLKEYKDKSRIADMKLSMNSYLGHLVSLGWEHDHYEVTKKDDFGSPDVKVINGVRIPVLKCPRDLFTHPKVYAYSREMKKAKA